jgi:hypothetical protein
MLARYHMPGLFMILSIGANPNRLRGDTCGRLAVKLRTSLIYSISQVFSHNLALRQLIRDAYCRLATNNLQGDSRSFIRLLNLVFKFLISWTDPIPLSSELYSSPKVREKVSIFTGKILLLRLTWILTGIF